ncbi:MAG: hypothetical protein QF464_24525, partial [Myxococcota bacterium]|nr:hypothetical protein [Myxococcota bacterium]
ALVLGETVTGEIGTPFEEVRYEMTVDPGQRIAIDLVEAENKFRIGYVLEDALGRAVTESLGQFDDSGLITLIGGSYVLRVLSDAGGTSTYTFTIYDVPETTITPITIGAEVSGAVEVPGQELVYTFEAAASQKLFVERTSLTEYQGPRLEWSVTDAAGRTIVTQNLLLGDLGPVTLVGGSYRLTFTGEGSSKGSFVFQLVDQGTADPFVPTGEPLALG